MDRRFEGFAAVITGDVVGSTAAGAPSRESLLDALKGLTGVLRDTFGPAAVPYPVDVYGGDTWQVLLTPPSSALRAALLIRALLHGHVQDDHDVPIATRMVVARGPVDTLSDGRLSESDGPAFRLSGRGLDALGDRRLAFANATRSHLDDWDVVFHLLDAIASEWTPRQARTVSGALRGWRQERIAALWTPPVSQPTVAGHLRAARWDAIEAAVTAFEARVRELEEEME